MPALRHISVRFDFRTTARRAVVAMLALFVMFDLIEAPGRRANEARGQSLPALPTPLPQPFSPNGVLRPINPIVPTTPVPTLRHLSIVPLPINSPNLTIRPMGTPSSIVAAQSQGLLSPVPMHRRWPILQPLASGATPGNSSPGANGASARMPAGSAPRGEPSRRNAAGLTSAQPIAPHRRPLGW